MKAIILAEAGKWVTFGTAPNKPHTGYGYIKKRDFEGAGFVVDTFFEKPSVDVAEHYFNSGQYLWDSEIFLFRASRYLKKLKNFRSDIFEVSKVSMEGVEADLDFVRINNEKFTECASESLDYAVMEKTADAGVVPMDAGWSDIGSWSSLWDISNKHKNGNVSHGDVLLHNTNNSFVMTDEKLVATVGVNDLVSASTKDAVMVAHKDNVQDAKMITQQVKDDNRNKWNLKR